jgi:hypothetical protein
MLVEQLFSLDSFNPVHKHLGTSANLELLEALVKNSFVRQSLLELCLLDAWSLTLP